MRHATAVIGANYGDEGKGLVVDALCDHGPDTVVVRFNGGAQAGHTVVTPDGFRHVFHHHGAGSMRFAATYLSEHFIVNPQIFMREHAALLRPTVMLSPRAIITTPYDMMLNQWAEEDRAGARHGSCGLGINETVERCNTEWRTDSLNMLAIPSVVHLRAIANDYVPMRANDLGIQLTDYRRALLASRGIVDHYLTACELMHRAISFRDAHEVRGHIIFEGAQGLLLDQNAPGFPHVTRSNTGLANVDQLCRQMHITSLDAVFVTRTYFTRHGAGPMPGEDPALQRFDPTNQPNEWQHEMRFGILDVPDLLARIFHETRCVRIPVNRSIAMTCVDQLDNARLREMCPWPMHESHGPTRDTFRPVRALEK